MKRRGRNLVPGLLVFALGCATVAPPAPEAPLLSPADLVASLAEVANGRNADMAETGLVLKQIELRLAVGRERRRDGRVSVLVLDLDASRRTETSFTQTFTLQLPPPSRRRTAATAAAIPGVVDFVEPRCRRRASSSRRRRGGAAQKLRRSSGREDRPADRVGGGVAFRLFTGASLSAGRAGRGRDQHGAPRVRGAVTPASGPPKTKSGPEGPLYRSAALNKDAGAGSPTLSPRRSLSASPPGLHPSPSSTRGT